VSIPISILISILLDGDSPGSIFYNLHHRQLINHGGEYMETWMNNLNHWFEQLPGLLRRHRFSVVMLFVLITVGLGAGAGRIVIDNSLESFFRDNDPVKKSYDHFKTVFGGDEYIYIVYKAKDGDIFSEASLGALKGVYDELTQYRLGDISSEPSPLDHIVEIKSLINIKPIEARGDALYSGCLIGDNLPGTSTQREQLREKALKHPDFPYVFLSPDCRYGGVLLRTDFNSELAGTEPEGLSREAGGGDIDDHDDLAEPLGFESWDGKVLTPDFKKTAMDEYPLLISALRTILKKNTYSGVLEFHPVGKPVLMDFFADAVMNDMGRIMGWVLLLILGMLVVLFRSLSAVVWPLVLIFVTLVWVCGIIGWSGVPMSIMFQIIVFLILAVGVADAVHFLSGYLYIRNTGLCHVAALDRVMKQSGMACFLTSLTTAVGLFALALVPVKPIAVFGLFSAIGVMTAFVLTLVFIPLMLDVWSPYSSKGKRHVRVIQGLVGHAVKTVTGKPGWVIAVFAVLCAFFVNGLVKIRIDSDDIDVLKKGLPLRESYEMVNEYLGGSGTMEIALDFKTADALKDPLVLNHMEALQDYLINHAGSRVVKTQSVVNVVKESNKALHNGDDHFNTIPQEPDVLAQTLFLFENANPADRRRLVTDDYAQARIGIHSKNLSSVSALAFKDQVEHYIELHFKPLETRYPGFSVTLTGHMALLAAMLDYISWSQIKSFGLTLIVISLILFVVFGNAKAGLIAVIPNVFPIVTTFGIMGYLDIPLDMDTLLIAPVIIGLAVDDTIHFLTHYKLAMDQCTTLHAAVTHSLNEAGHAICFTSLILASGFSMFVLSFHNGLSHFGILSAAAILTACIADLYLLPALCVLVHLNFDKGGGIEHRASAPLTRDFQA